MCTESLENCCSVMGKWLEPKLPPILLVFFQLQTRYLWLGLKGKAGRGTRLSSAGVLGKVCSHGRGKKLKVTQKIPLVTLQVHKVVLMDVQRAWQCCLCGSVLQAEQGVCQFFSKGF